jgi:hypothetical protein
VTAGMSGALITARWLATTMIGRAIVLTVALVVTFGYFKAHFTKVESAKWQAEVVKKQGAILDKVTSINAETKAAQQAARMQSGYMDKVLAVVIGGIWKTEKPDPVEAETIDLINETRSTVKH